MITIETLQERPLSFSSIKEFAKSPRHYLDYISKQKTPPTDAMKLGSMVHCMMLQPALFNDLFAVAPEINKRTNAGKEEWNAFCTANEGKTVVANEDYEHARRLSDGAMLNPRISEMIKSCYDFECEWSADIEGLPFKGFYDGISTDYVLEIKTINDAHPKNVMSDFFRRKYHMQAGLYHMSSLCKPVVYIVIETTEPYLCYVAQSDEAYLNKGVSDTGKLIDKFKFCMDNNLFNSGYDFHYDGVIEIQLPWGVEN